MGSIDQKLLSYNANEEEIRRKLNRSKINDIQKNNNNARSNKNDFNIKSSDNLKKVIDNSFKVGESKLLRQMWMWIVPSFGLSLIYINIHVLLRYVVGEDTFCKLGEEQQLSKSNIGINKTKINVSIGLLESIGLVLLDFFLMIVVIIALTLLILVIYILMHPIKSFFSLFLN